MSKIERIELFHVNIPLKDAFWPSWIPGYPQTHSQFTLIKLTTDDGLVGMSAGNSFGKERMGLGDLLGSFLIGIEANDIQTVRMRLREASYLGWRNWWIEPAFFDLKGKMAGKPVYKLLQDKEETVEKAKIYASTGTVMPFEERKPYLDDIREKGIDAIKIRVKDPEMKDDISILKDVRKELGNDFTISVDANQGWPVSLIDPTPKWTLDYATEFGKACDDLNIAWIEEPLDMHDWEGMSELRKRIKTKLAGAELHGDWHELKPLFEHECFDMYQPDCTFVGGLTVAKQVMDECKKRGLRYSPHTWTNGVGLVINSHAFAANDDRYLLEYPYEKPGWIPEFRDGIIEHTLVNPDGTINIPQEPGLGIKIDEQRFKKYAKRFYKATPLRVAVKTIREKGIKEALKLKKKMKAKA